MGSDHGRRGAGIGRHLRAHWRVWLGLAIVVVIANELMDRNFFDHREHIDGDFVVTLAVLLIAFFGSYAFVRLTAGRFADPAR